MLENYRRHIFSVFLFKLITFCFIPRNYFFIKCFISATFCIGAAVKKIQIESISVRTVRGFNRYIICTAAVYAFGLSSYTIRQGFIYIVELVFIGDANLPIVITEGYGKRYVAFCNRFKQGVDRFCNGVLKFFPLSLVRHSISFDLVAGIHNKIRFFIFNCRIEQSHSVRRYFRYLLHIGNLHNFK